jgi:hypothetical protein
VATTPQKRRMMIEDRKGGAMKKDQEATGAKRREFLKLAGLGAVTGAAAAVGAKPAAANVAADGKRAGYRETAHVKKAYELARF